ncbi:MAG: Zn-dependent alcohol dehydrogenase [Gracilibacteraceae bacterium]|jgi:S-(hydroxymethyl)glutathione dehydrogenase/alcohol dehydrogenase|nr:Zn-dependent alcohol dehydrogenase [Gracilibacteraceae bacterium]
MKAAVMYEPKKDFVVEEIEILPPKSKEVLIRMAASGVCRSDYARLMWERPSVLPIVLGHEGAGIVEKIGAGVTRVKPGDKVMLTWAAPCGVCHSCQTGKYNICAEAVRERTSCTMRDGTTRLRKGGREIHHFDALSTFAEYAVVNESACIICPEGVPLTSAALIGCAVMTGIGAVWNTARVNPGSTVAVTGAGGVGLNSIQAAACVSASQVIVIDVDEQKLEFAKQFGATTVINAKSENPVERVMELTNGSGVDFAFDCVGSPKTIGQLWDAVRPGGTVVVVGVAPVGENASIPGIQLAFSEKILRGSLYGETRPHVDFARIVNLYQLKKIKLDELVTKTYKLEEINQAFADLIAGKNVRGVIVY